MKNIKPCPFCGYTFKEEDREEFCYPYGKPIDGKQLWVVGCIETAGGCSANVLGMSRGEAIRLWNTRKI
jgi:hypothetical protein